MKSDFRNNESKKYTTSKNSKRIYEVAKRVLTQKMKNTEERLRRPPTAKELGQRRRILATISAGAIGATVIAGTGIFKKNTDNHPQIDSNESGFNYITKYEYTNAYNQKPDNNKIDKMYEGDLIEYNSLDKGYYYKTDDDWEIEDGEDTARKTSWVKCTTISRKEEGYIPSVYVDTFHPYNVVNTATFITEAKEDDEKKQKKEEILERTRVWVFDEFAIDEENGLYSAIIKDENNQYIKGKITKDGLEKDRNNNINIGVINSSTFIREYPLVTELDEKILIKNEENNELIRIYNGEKVKVKEEIYDKSELWYKCEIEGHEGEIYLSSIALKPINDFETEMDIIADGGKITSLDGKERYSLKKGEKIHVDLESKTNNGLYYVMIDTGEKATVGYMTEESLGLKEQTTEKIKANNEGVNLIPVTEEKKNSYKYILDFGYCLEYSNIESIVNDLVERDLIAGITVRVGTTLRFRDDFEILGFTDDKEEYMNANEDTVLLDTGYKQMQEKSSEPIKFVGDLGSIKNLERIIQLAVDNDLAFGTYYYQGSVEENRTSAEAAYMYNLDKKLKADMGETYINAKKMPFMDDFEDQHEKIDKDYIRVKQFKYKTELLGNGVSEDGFWTIDDIDPKQGYHLLDDYNNRVIFYSAIIRTTEITSNSIFEIEKELEEEGYTVIYNSTRDCNLDKLTYDEVLNIEDIEEFAYDGVDYYINKYKSFDKSLYDRSDLMQVFLDVIAVNGFKIDLSLASQKTIDEIINGTYEHHCTYEEQLEEVKTESKYTITTYKAADEKEITNQINKNQKGWKLDSGVDEIYTEQKNEFDFTFDETQSENIVVETKTNSNEKVAEITKKAEIEENELEDR